MRANPKIKNSFEKLKKSKSINFMASRFVFPVHFEVENAVGVDYESALALTLHIFTLYNLSRLENVPPE